VFASQIVTDHVSEEGNKIGPVCFFSVHPSICWKLLCLLNELTDELDSLHVYGS